MAEKLESNSDPRGAGVASDATAAGGGHGDQSEPRAAGPDVASELARERQMLRRAQRMSRRPGRIGRFFGVLADLAGTDDASTSAGTRAGLRWLSADVVLRLALPLVVVAIFFAIWQWLPLALGIPTYELPNLSATLQGLHDDWPDIGIALLVTFQDALAGFILGNLLAILGATVFAYSINSERAFYPLAILVQTVPIIVYVPLMVVVFDRVPALNANSSSAAVVAVTILISFFPTLVNMNVGFKTIDPRIYEFMRLLNASRTQIFLKLRFPSAMPFLFSSLKITSTLAFVGAVVGEWMAGSGINPVGQVLSNFGVNNLLGFPTNPFQASGVGYQLSVFLFRLDKPGIFASVFVISMLSMVFFGLVVLLEKIFVPWQKTQ